MPEFQASGEVVKTEVVTPLLDRGSMVLPCLETDTGLVFEGDIKVVRPLPELQNPTVGENFGIVFHGHGIVNEKYLWPDGVIPCAIHASIDQVVSAAIQHWSSYTPLKFVAYRGQPSYLAFEPGFRNESEVGRQGGKQIVSLTPGATLGWALHEIGHAIGLWHEHSRSDRDSHIVVHYDNIRPGGIEQFAVRLHNAQHLGPYDYDSAMHYPETAFAKAGETSIARIDGSALGARKGLSPGDIVACKKLYPELDW